MTQNGVYVGTGTGSLQAYEAWAGGAPDNTLDYLNNNSWSEFASSIPWAVELSKATGLSSVWSVPLTVWGTSLEQVASGAYNDYFLKAANALAQSKPSADGFIYVRLGWEFNSSWMPWAAAGNEQAFIKAFQDVVTVFRSVSDDFKFVWDVNQGASQIDPAKAYPGDKFVDVIGMDTYYNTAYDNPDPLQAFNWKVIQPYGLQWQQDFAAAHGKGTAISEWGVENGTSGRYIEAISKWMSDHNMLYQNYWYSDAGGFNGVISDKHNAQLGSIYKDAFVTDSHDAAVDVTIDTVSGDGYINAIEAGEALVVTGSLSAALASGGSLQVTIGGGTYAAVVDGKVWSVSLTAKQVATLTSGAVSAVVVDAMGNADTKVGSVASNIVSSVVDKASNSGATASSAYTVDKIAPTATATISAVAGDGIINAAEAAQALKLTGSLSGTLAADESLNVTIGGTTYTASVNSATKTWSVDLSASQATALASGKVSAVVVDKAGNSGATASSVYTVDKIAPTATATISAVAGDGIINAAEAAQALKLTGSLSGTLAADESLNVTIGGTTYTASVNSATKTWSVDLSASQATALASGKVSAVVVDKAGNSGATASSVYTVDKIAPTATATISAVAGDGIINAAEAAQALKLTGSLSGTLAADESLNVTIGGTTYTASVNSATKTWSVDLSASQATALASGKVSAVVVDKAGNSGAIASSAYTVDKIAPTATATISAVAGDGIINAAEAAQALKLTGSLSGTLAADESLNVTIGGTTYTASVNSATKTWSVDLSASQATALASGKVSAVVVDKAGNSGAIASSAYTVDKIAPITIGSGSDHLLLRISEDAFQGDAQYTISVDGKQVGGVQTAHAVHTAGQSDQVMVLGEWGEGKHTVAVNFLNDAYGYAADKDRNLYIDGASYNDATVADATRALLGNGAQTFTFHDTAPVAAPTQLTTTIGSGSDHLLLRISEDAFQGDAQYTISVDGKQVGGIQTAHAVHTAGQSDQVMVLGEWGEGKHTVAVNFLNDAYGYAADKDRNLYIDGASYNDATVADATRALLGNGAQTFTFHDTAPVAAPTQLTTTIGSGSDHLLLRISEDAFQGDAQYTISVDGKQVGGIQTAHAVHTAGQSDQVMVLGEWGEGKHTVAVNFLNDAYGYAADKDRNLYIDGASYNDATVADATHALLGNGAQTFTFHDTAWILQ